MRKVSKEEAHWAGKILHEQKEKPGRHPQAEVSRAGEILAQWKKQGEKED